MLRNRERERERDRGGGGGGGGGVFGHKGKRSAILIPWRASPYPQKTYIKKKQREKTGGKWEAPVRIG